MASGDLVVPAVLEHRPDVALLDVEMPGLDGISAAAEVRRVSPSTRVLIVTTFGRPGFLRRAMQSGADGFVVKDTPAAQLADAVRRVHQGLRVVDPALAMDSLTIGDSPLTERETDVLRAARRRRRRGRRRAARPPVPRDGPQPSVLGHRQDRCRQPLRGRAVATSTAGSEGRRSRISRPAACATSSTTGGQAIRTTRRCSTSADSDLTTDATHDSATRSRQADRRPATGSRPRMRRPPGARDHEQHQPHDHQQRDRPPAAARSCVPRSRKSTHARPIMPREGQRRDPRRRRRRAGSEPAASGAGVTRGVTPLRLTRPVGLVAPVGVVVPLLVALLRLLQRALGLVLGVVGAESVDRRAHVGWLRPRWCFTQYQYLAMPPPYGRADLALRRLGAMTSTAIAPAAISPRRAVPGAIAAPGVRRPARAGAVHRQRGQGRRDHRQDPGRLPAGRAGPRRSSGAHVAPGVTTDELDRIGHEFLCDHGAYPSTLGYKGFPKSLCTSVNEVICHGIPDARVRRGRRHRQHRHHRLPRRRPRRHQRDVPGRRGRRRDPRCWSSTPARRSSARSRRCGPAAGSA